MIVGIDFDNTIVSYEGIFHAAAVERGLLPADAPRHKQGVRDALRAMDREADWTELQGHVYGPGLAAAPPYPQVAECIAFLLANGVQVHIVSHKTRYPYLGDRHDLHAAARSWLAAQGFVDTGMLDESQVFLEQSKAEKLQRIAALGCGYFIDDLEEFLTDPDFPATATPILFRPQHSEAASPVGNAPADRTLLTMESWAAVTDFFRALLPQNQPGEPGDSV